MRNHIPLLFEIDDCGAIGAAMLPMSQLDINTKNSFKGLLLCLIVLL